MRRRGLSFYTRRKIMHRFLEDRFLDPREFTKFLERHGIDISEEQLEEFEEEGWLQPIFRVVAPDQLQGDLPYPNSYNIKHLYKEGLIEIPKKGDYEPWSSGQTKHKTQQRTKQSYYHQFQIFQVVSIYKNKECRFIYFDSYKKQDLNKIVANMEKWKENHIEQPRTRSLSSPETIGLLMLLEEPYHYYAFGSKRINLHSRDYFASWRNWERTKFSAEKLLEDSGLTIEQVRGLHDDLVVDVNFLDPLMGWYDLIRIMKMTSVNELKGDALRAQFYYKTIRMMAWFLYDLTGEKMKEPDLFFDAREGRWKTDVYSDPFDYKTRKTQRAIIQRFLGTPTTRLYLVIEGETEQYVIEKIFEKLGISTQDDGIQIKNRAGISNMCGAKLKDIIQSANRDNIAMYVIMDNEDNAKSKIESIKKQVIADFDYHIWDISFEDDHFERSKVLALVNSYLKKETNDHKLLCREVDKEQKSRNPRKPLSASIESAYKAKYGKVVKKNIWEVIKRGKPQIALELMENHIKNISPSKQDANPMEIEKVLHKAFRMIPI